MTLGLAAENRFHLLQLIGLVSVQPMEDLIGKCGEVERLLLPLVHHLLHVIDVSVPTMPVLLATGPTLPDRALDMKAAI